MSAFWNMKKTRVAIVHYWLVGMRGGEKVLEALCRMFPEADIYTHVYVPDAVSETIRSHRVNTSFVARLPYARLLYQTYLPLMPMALEQIDLQAYDLVISSEAGPAKGVISAPHATHLSYVHSPMRYIWDQYYTYRQTTGWLKRAMMAPIAHGLRVWDVTSAARVDAFIANSSHVANRIHKYWRRPSRVVHPPVAVNDFRPVTSSARGDFFLWVGEFAPYKRPDLVVDAFNRLKLPLVMIGGPEVVRARLAARAQPNITFLGHVNFSVIKDHMARCRALVFPGEEDFGIVPVEAMASGRPVIALGRGGALDTVKDMKTGLLFYEQTVQGVMDAIERFISERLDDLPVPDLLAHARGFDEQNFRNGIVSVLSEMDATLPKSVL